MLGIHSDTSPDEAIKKAEAGPSPDDTESDLAQCDPTAVAKAIGLDPEALKKTGGKDQASGITIPNLDIAFSTPFGINDCDPWLSNFQKILTDGDPDLTGTFKEVAFQSFVPNLVHFHGRIATGDEMKDCSRCASTRTVTPRTPRRSNTRSSCPTTSTSRRPTRSRSRRRWSCATCRPTS